MIDIGLECTSTWWKPKERRIIRKLTFAQECWPAMTTGSLASASLRMGWRYDFFCPIMICYFTLSYLFLCRCALGHGTHSWRSGTKQEWFDSGSTEFKFPTKFSTRQLVTRFKWRTATIGTDTCMCLKVPWSQKGILRTVRFRFEITTISNLEKRYFLKPAKLQDSESSCQA